jgi:hypothetical protein
MVVVMVVMMMMMMMMTMATRGTYLKPELRELHRRLGARRRLGNPGLLRRF